MPLDTRITSVLADEMLRQARLLSPQGFRPEFNAIGRALRDIVKEGFVTELDPYGNPWPRLARSTVRFKAKNGVANPEGILKETGALSNSFQYRALSNGVRLFSTRVFDDGTTAEIHQEGGEHPVSGNIIPQRRMLPDDGNWPPEWENVVDRIIGDGIDRLFP